MTDNRLDEKEVENPKYSIAEIMDLLGQSERAVRTLIKKAGVDIDESKSDTSERIKYADYRKLWLSRANRREGKLLAKLLTEKSESWFDKIVHWNR